MVVRLLLYDSNRVFLLTYAVKNVKIPGVARFERFFAPLAGIISV